MTVSRVAVRCALFSAWNTLPPKPSARPFSPLRYLPVSMPPPSGDQVTMPRPSAFDAGNRSARSEEHTSELQSLMRISYAVLCLKNTTTYTIVKQHKIQVQHSQDTEN